MYVRSHLWFVFQLFGQYFMEDSGKSDVFSKRDERSVASDSYDIIPHHTVTLMICVWLGRVGSVRKRKRGS